MAQKEYVIFRPSALTKMAMENKLVGVFSILFSVIGSIEEGI